MCGVFKFKLKCPLLHWTYIWAFFKYCKNSRGIICSSVFYWSIGAVGERRTHWYNRSSGIPANQRLSSQMRDTAHWPISSGLGTDCQPIMLSHLFGVPLSSPNQGWSKTLGGGGIFPLPPFDLQLMKFFNPYMNLFVWCCSFTCNTSTRHKLTVFNNNLKSVPLSPLPL